MQKDHVALFADHHIDLGCSSSLSRYWRHWCPMEWNFRFRVYNECLYFINYVDKSWVGKHQDISHHTGMTRNCKGITNLQQVNNSEMNGNWTFHLDFCNEITANPEQGNRINFGSLAFFDYANPARNQSVGLEFNQIYVSPTFSTTLNIYCGNFKEMNCSAVPGSAGPTCLGSVSQVCFVQNPVFFSPFQASYCICSIGWANQSVFNSLQINVLSISCPVGVPVPKIPPKKNTALIVFLSYVLLFVPTKLILDKGYLGLQLQ